MEHSTSSTPSSELSLLSIGEDLIPIRPSKAAGQTELSFSGLLDPPLKLHEDLKEGCGGQSWPAGMLLAGYLLRNLDIIKEKTVQLRSSQDEDLIAVIDHESQDADYWLELGAGGGLVSLALALALSRQPQLKSVLDSVDGLKPLFVTDLPALLPLQEQNIALNRLHRSMIVSAALPWGSPIPDAIPEAYRHPDIVLAADCVYFEPAFPLLLATLSELLAPRSAFVKGTNGSESQGIVSKGTCYLCMKKRRKADMRFVALLKKRFIVETIDLGDLLREEGMESSIYLYKVYAKDP